MEKKNIGNIVRYSIGILFIIGMFGMTSDSVLAGIFMGLFGVSLLPVVYDKFIYSNFKLDKSSYLHIILPILLFFVMCVFMPETEVETNTDNTVNNNVVNEEVVKDEDKTEDKETTEETATENETTEEDTKETVTEEENKTEENKQEEPKEETTNTKPATSTTTKQPTQQTNPSDNKGNENKQETNTPSTPATTPTVTPTPEPEPTPTPTPTPTPEPEQETTPSAPTQNSRTVYRTPTGKRYHLDPECGGKNSRPTTLDEATSSGLTPCQKCAQ